MKGYIRRRGKRSWQITIELERDAEGKRQQAFHTVRGTKRDAQQRMHELIHQLNQGEYVKPQGVSVGEYLEQWLEGAARRKVAPKTFARYAEICRKHLSPAFGSIALDKLSPMNIDEYYSRALKEGRLKGSGGLSARTVLQHHRILHEALRQAVHWRLIGRNPTDAVHPPRPRQVEMRALNYAETVQLLAAARNTRLYVPILFVVTTGLARSELLALRWRDIDLDASSVTVNRSVTKVKGEIFLKDTKARKRRRRLPLLQIAVEALRRHRARQNEERLLLGPGYQDQDLVFPDIDGSFWDPESLSGLFRTLVKHTAIGHVRFHDLRHTHATQMLLDNVHPKIVSERLGHSTVSITLDIYSHVQQGMQEEAVNRLDAVYREELKDEE